MSEKYTSEGMPLVNEAVLEVFLRNVDRTGLEGRTASFFSELSRDIQQKNPVFWKEIMQYKSDSENYSPNPRDHGLGVLAGAIIAYELLRRQAETNQLETG